MKGLLLLAYSVILLRKFETTSYITKKERLTSVSPLGAMSHLAVKLRAANIQNNYIVCQVYIYFFFKDLTYAKFGMVYLLMKSFYLL
jgi:hypothetical protein